MSKTETCHARKRRRAPRLTDWTLVTLALLLALALLAPEQLQVVLYKAGLVTLGAAMGYWIDRSLFPYGRPHECIGFLLIGMSMLRRAMIVLACVLGLTLGL